MITVSGMMARRGRMSVAAFLAVGWMARQTAVGVTVFAQDDFNDGTLASVPEGENWRAIEPTGGGPVTNFETYDLGGGNRALRLGRDPLLSPNTYIGAHVYDKRIPGDIGTMSCVQSDILYVDPPDLGDPNDWLGVLGYGQSWVTGGTYDIDGAFYAALVRADPTTPELGLYKRGTGFLATAPIDDPTQFLQTLDAGLRIRLEIEEGAGIVSLGTVLTWDLAGTPATQTLTVIDSTAPILGGGTAGVWAFALPSVLPLNSKGEPVLQGVPDSYVSGLFDNFHACSSIPEPAVWQLAVAGVAFVALMRARGFRIR